MLRALLLINWSYWHRHYRQLLIIGGVVVVVGLIVGAMFYRLGGLLDPQNPAADWILRLTLALATVIGFWQTNRYAQTKSGTLTAHLLAEERFYQFFLANGLNIALSGVIVLGSLYIGINGGWLATPFQSGILLNIGLLTASWYGIGTAFAIISSCLTTIGLIKTTLTLTVMVLIVWLFGVNNFLLWQRLHFQLIHPSLITLIAQLITAKAVLASSLALIEYHLPAFLLQRQNRKRYWVWQSFHRALNRTTSLNGTALQIALIHLVRNKQMGWRLSGVIIALLIIGQF